MREKKISKSQIVSLERFEQVARRSANRRVLSTWLVASFITLVFVGLELFPVWVAMSINSLVCGVFLYLSSDYVDDQVSVWIERVMDYEVQVDRDGFLTSSEVENGEFYIKTGSDGRPEAFEVSLSWNQLREIINAGFEHEKLTRSALSSRNWSNLNEMWKNKEIQSSAMRLGLIDVENKFLFGWGGDIYNDGPEVDNQTDTGVGVGGYQND